jgi:cysteine desulfurase
MQRRYLDYNATAPLRLEAKEAIVKVMEDIGNASSIHWYGRQVRQTVESARQVIADYFGVSSARVVFTSGATESNNFALKGFKGIVITSAIEHDSVLTPRPDSLICSVDSNGLVDLSHLEALLQQQTGPVLVSIMAANNETGVIQPLEHVRTLCDTYQAWLHCDATQAIGKGLFDWQRLNCDLISCSSHKIGGPSGMGALIIQEKLPLFPLLRGGGQERSFRAGTENILGIVGFARALEVCQHDDWSQIQQWRNQIEETLIKHYPDVTVFGSKVPRLPNTTNLTMPNVPNALQVMNFDLAGIALSAGAACSSGKVKPSHVLKAMGVADHLAQSSIRISLGWKTIAQDVQQFIKTWQEIYHRLDMNLERTHAA